MCSSGPHSSLAKKTCFSRAWCYFTEITWLTLNLDSVGIWQPLTDGQFIAEAIVLASNQPMANEIFWRISALVSTMGQIKKIKDFFYIKGWIICRDFEQS